MLEDLLRAIGKGGTHSYDDLAAQLGVSRPLVEAMIQDLVRLGYLKPAVGACPSAPACRAGCGLGGCSTGCSQPGCMWTLTERGAKSAGRPSP